MPLAKDLNQPETLSEAIVFLPSDLWSDEPPLETYLHLQQMILLLNCLNCWWRERKTFLLLGI